MNKNKYPSNKLHSIINGLEIQVPLITSLSAFLGFCKPNNNSNFFIKTNGVSYLKQGYKAFNTKGLFA